MIVDTLDITSRSRVAKLLLQALSKHNDRAYLAGFRITLPGHTEYKTVDCLQQLGFVSVVVEPKHYTIEYGTSLMCLPDRRFPIQVYKSGLVIRSLGAVLPQFPKLLEEFKDRGSARLSSSHDAPMYLSFTADIESIPDRYGEGKETVPGRLVYDSCQYLELAVAKYSKLFTLTLKEQV